MKRKFTLLAAALMLLSCLAVPLGMRGQTYNLISEVSEIEDGDYVIAAKVGNKYYALSNTFSTQISGAEITVTDGVISSSDATNYVVTIDKDDNGRISITNGTNYLNCKSSGTNFEVGNTAYFHDVTKQTSNGTFMIKHQSATRGIIYRTSTYNKFGNYSTPNVNGTEYYNVELFKYTSSGYTITCATDLANGSISADMNTASENDVVTITASPDAGYDFEAITVTKAGGGTIDAGDIIYDYDDNTAAFEMPADNVTVSATFTAKPTYLITLNAITGGTVTTNVTNNMAYEGQTVTLTATPNTNYTLSTLTATYVDGESTQHDLTINSSNQFTMPAYPVTVTATFVPYYTVTCATGLSHGSISADMETAVENETVIITAVPDAGYDFEAITVTKAGGGTIAAGDIIYVGNTAAFEMPADNVTVSATFTAKPTYLITLVASPVAGGTVTTNVTDNLAYEGQTVTLTATPNTNYNLSTLTATYVDGESTQHDLTINSSKQFTMPAYPVTVTATFVEHHSYDIDFESTTYTDWEFTSVNSKQTNTNVTAHGGSYFGSTSITSSNNNSIIVTKNKIANPKSLTCYVTKQSTNSTTSTWYIEVSDDGSTWTEVTSRDATNMNKGEWVEFSATLISYHNVYVRVRYTGSTAVRNIDDLSLEYTPNEYAVNVSSVANGTITASDGTTTITEGNSANIESGKTVTLTAEGDATHMFSAWSVTGATVADASSATTTFEMPANAVTVSATFVESWSFTYNINGNTVTEKYARNDASITLPTTSEYCPEGYSIRGWTETESDLSSPIASATANQDRTFYAIFGKKVYGDFVKVTTGQTTYEGYYLIVYESDNGNVALNGNLGTIDQEYNTISVEISNNTIVSNNATKAAMFTIESNGENTYSIRSAKGYYIGASSSGSLSQTDNKTTYKHSISAPGGIAAITCGSVGLKYNASAHRFRYYSSGQATIRLYKSELSLSGSYTRVYTKDIAGYGDDNEVTTGWHLIASPVAISPEDVTNMTTATYDLYKFNEEHGKWYNYKVNSDPTTTNAASGFSLVPGEGYLYAHNGAGVTLSFPGVPYSGDGQVTLKKQSSGTLAGWNLVGNPFGDSNAIIAVGQGDPAREFYRMNDDGSDVTLTSGPIAAMEGVFVVAASDNEVITIEETDATVGAKGASVVMNLGQNRGSVIDRAIVHFDESKAMPKFQLFENSTKLYIAQNGEDYASVRSEAQGEMPVSFRANENGQYTLTVNPEGVEMNYLHLIDNMTGADIDLLQTPSYTFNANVTDYESRFKLVFATNNEDGASTGSATFAFYSNGNWIISNIGEATLQVVDVNGRILSSETVNGSVSKTINATPGVYMLRLIHGENVKVQKIVVR